MQRNYLFSLTIAAILAAILAGCGQPETATFGTKTAVLIRAKVVKVAPQSAPIQLDAAGAVKPLYQSDLSAKFMAKVAKVFVREGETVHKGEPLLVLDASELQAGFDSAQSAYRSTLSGVDSARTTALMTAATTRAKLIQAQATVVRAKASFAAAIAKRDLVVAGTRTQELSQKKYAVTAAQSDLATAKIELDRTQSLYKAGAVAKRDLDQAQNRYAQAESNYQSALAAESQAQEGSRVQDVAAANQSVLEAKAAVKESEAALVGARADLMQIQVDQKAVEVARANSQQALSGVRSAEVELQYGTLTAPFDGRISKRLADPGLMAEPGVPLMSIEGGPYDLVVQVPEKWIGHVKKGQTVSVKIDSSGAGAKGVVSEIQPKADASSHTYAVKVRLDGRSFYAGMFGKASFTVGFKSGLFIPQSATWSRSGMNYVYVVSNSNLAELRIVTLGDNFGNQVQVLSGLNAGETIIAANPESASDGAQIEPETP